MIFLLCFGCRALAGLHNKGTVFVTQSVRQAQTDCKPKGVIAIFGLLQVEQQNMHGQTQDCISASNDKQHPEFVKQVANIIF